MDLINKLASDNGILGLFLALALLAIMYLYKSLMLEKDKELKDKDTIIENVTIVLRAVDNTQKAILIELEKNNEKKETC